MVGVTVELDRHYVHFAKTQHTFTPVEIGLMPSPKQIYELYNGGALPVKYFIDIEPLEQLRHVSDNYNISCNCTQFDMYYDISCICKHFDIL